MYTIRYRSALHPDSVRLIVEDASGAYHLFNCHPDHCSLITMPDEDAQAESLARLGWQRVPETAPYSLDALRGLMTGLLNRPCSMNQASTTWPGSPATALSPGFPGATATPSPATACSSPASTPGSTTTSCAR